MSSVTCVSCKTKHMCQTICTRVVCQSCRKSLLNLCSGEVVRHFCWGKSEHRPTLPLWYWRSRLFLTFRAWLLERRHLGKSDRPNIRCFAAVLWGNLDGVKLPPKRACGQKILALMPQFLEESGIQGQSRYVDSKDPVRRFKKNNKKRQCVPECL